MKNCKLVGKVVKVEEECVAGHYVGEEFELSLFAQTITKL